MRLSKRISQSFRQLSKTQAGHVVLRGTSAVLGRAKKTKE